MTAPAHVTSNNYRLGVKKEEKIKAQIREEAAKNTTESKPYVPPLMPKLDANGRPIFNTSTNSPINASSPTGARPGLPLSIGNSTSFREIGEGSWIRRSYT